MAYLFSFILILMGNNEQSEVHDLKCPEIKIAYEIEEINQLYEVKVTPSGGEGSYHYTFFDERGFHLTKDYKYTSNKVEIKSKGTYYAVVYDQNGCSAKITFEIK